jgi:hypothetical protein
MQTNVLIGFVCLLFMMNLVLQMMIGNLDYVEVKNVHRRMELRRWILFKRLSKEETLSVL